MDAVYLNTIEIGTAETAGSWTYSPLCAGIEGMDFADNEQAQQYFFLCGNGGAQNEITGLAPEIVITGRRIVGDTAQDYIAGKNFQLGSARKSSVKVTTGGKVITCGCTISAIKSFGGQALDVNEFGCTIKFNGLPEVTDAT